MGINAHKKPRRPWGAAWLSSRLRCGAYLLVPPLCAGALFDGVVEVDPPAPAGAGLLEDGLTTGVFFGFGVLDPTPVVCDFGMRACAMRVCCCLCSRAVRVICCFFPR